MVPRVSYFIHKSVSWKIFGEGFASGGLRPCGMCILRALLTRIEWRPVLSRQRHPRITGNGISLSVRVISHSTSNARFIDARSTSLHPFSTRKGPILGKKRGARENRIFDLDRLSHLAPAKRGDNTKDPISFSPGAKTDGEFLRFFILESTEVNCWGPSYPAKLLLSGALIKKCVNEICQVQGPFFPPRFVKALKAVIICWALWLKFFLCPNIKRLEWDKGERGEGAKNEMFVLLGELVSFGLSFASATHRDTMATSIAIRHTSNQHA